MNVEKREEWDPQATASFWMNHVSRTLTRVQNLRLEPFGFAKSQMPVLEALSRGRELPQKELVHGARVEQPSMAELLARMERDGLVEKKPNPADRRGFLYSLSRVARQRWSKAKRELARTERDALAGFSADEKAQLHALLVRVARNLEAVGSHA